ncbi:Ribosome-releasing factor 2, mitochondrial [Golovinomyces cichoracearum]|uniref:Ribosome-releasing factor 2, mitochondrial n=1 Tax=Golovinomyces cichoracearum TaxID=62708 RepID=A0A420JB35_9PEZI|nr:Ribosome-releasing factor 2, mitochondrial [Golovinomyces cichoracearum]
MSFSVVQKGGQIWRQNCHLTSILRISHFVTISRYYSSAILNHEQYQNLQRTRNIGIIAHIDAGKTTTTERMLYYSGFTRCLGDVDDGSTVTDFLPSERARGITIQSAAVTFNWPPVTEDCSTKINSQRSLNPHTINLIDTPGHADFTFEVLRSLRILDGAVCILDGVSGVEAQTEKVWAQAHKYKIPRIAFINKLDRMGATFERTVKEIASRLHGLPVLCQIPWWEGGKGRFCGVGDAINLCALKWESESDGKKIRRFSSEELSIEDAKFYAELTKARTALVENLCEFDDQLLEAWLSVNDNSLAISAQDIRESIRRCIIDGSGRLVPVFSGASFRNIGVQPLLDAIDDFLPDPTQRPDPEIKIGSQKSTLQDLLQGKLSLVPNPKKSLSKRKNDSMSLIKNLEACALAFKVVSDAHRGILVYIRVYSGSVKRNASLWNSNLQVTERPQRILQMHASDAVEISQIEAGQIGVIVGLKQTRTGDTLISYPNVHPKLGPPTPLNELQLRSIDIPPPVFFAAIEPHSVTEEKSVTNLLSVLLREDPSLHLSINEDSGQILLSGMGELHLEIARDRLVNDFKAQASMGNVEISYRECILVPTLEQRFTYDREIAGKKVKASCTVCIGPIDENLTPECAKMNKNILHGGNSISVHISSGVESIEDDHILPYDLSYSVIRTALSNGAIAALARGPRRSFPLHNTHVTIKFDLDTALFGKETSTAAISLAAKFAVQAALRESLSKNQIAIMEPVMDVLISCDQTSLGAVVHDLSAARGGQVVSLSNDDHDDAISCLPAVDPRKIYVPKDPFSNGVSESETFSLGQRRQVKARVPLKEMVGYLKHLRSLTAGRGTFIMNFDKFERLVGPREKLI